MKVQFKRGTDLRDAKGIYAYKGRSYPGATTVLGPHSDFIWVHMNEVGKYVVELYESVQTGELMPTWRETESGWEVVWETPHSLLLNADHVSKQGFRKLKEAADRGSTIHDMLADYAVGAAPDESQLDAYLQSLIFGKRRSCTIENVKPYAVSLLHWLDSVSPVLWVSEASCFNDTHEYAGTFDAIAEVEGELVMLDLKTSDTFKRTWMAQIGAYSHSELFVADDGNGPVECDTPQGLKCAVLQVLPDRYIYRSFDSEEAYKDLFLPALKAFQANKNVRLPKKGLTTKVGTDAQNTTQEEVHN